MAKVDSRITLIDNYLLNPDKYVFPFVIKETNKDRTIITYNESKEFGQSLRKVHEIVLPWFLDTFAERNPHSYAYQKGVRCSDALTPHLKSNYFIKLDIHSFFESITDENFFKHHGHYFNKKVTHLLQGCFYKGSLSIGFVTSPMISDFFMKDFDRHIEEYISNHPELHYSRYSDDILLSSEDEDNDNSLNALYEFVKSELALLGLEINPKKLLKRKLTFESHNSINYLGLAISKLDEFENKVTISKRYILFLLKLIDKNNKYGDKCKGLIDEINSRVAYLAYNSHVSYARFQKKHFNIYGKEYNFVPKKPLDRTQPILSNEIPDYDKYTKIFEIDLHKKIRGNNKYAFFKNDAICITKYIGKEETTVRIPAFVDSIGSNAFAFHSEISEIIFEGKIKHIGTGAFSRCTNLRRIVLPDSLRYIEPEAFYACNSLEEIVIPNRIKILENSVFAYTGLKTITLPNELKEIREKAFKSCEKLEEIDLPDSIEVIGPYAFANNPELKRVKLPNNLLTLQDFAFEGCHRLKDITLPDSLLEIQRRAFSNCSLIREINIPDKLVNIGENAFRGCDLLNHFIIKNNKVFSINSSGDLIETNSKKLIVLKNDTVDKDIKIISAYSFMNKDIVRINIPEGVEIIEEGAFQNCECLKEIILPSTLKEIGGLAFKGCINLKEIAIPDGIKKINESTFDGCIRLEKIILPESIEEIGNLAFNKDRKLDIALPKGLKVIGYKAFKDCQSIKNIFIGEFVKKINDKAFYGCSKSLESIKVHSFNTIYSSENANVLIDRKSETLILGCSKSFIPKGVSAIDDYAFYNCDGLKRITLPKSVTKIGKGSFYGCVNLEDFDYGNVYSIGEKAFYDTISLKQAILPESLTTLGIYAFYNSGIKVVRLPNSLSTPLQATMFDKASNIEEIHFSSSIRTISRSLFSSADNIKKITVDPMNNDYFDNGLNGVFTKIKAYGTELLELVFGCQNTILPNDLYTIDRSAFANSRGLKSIHINHPIILNDRVFANCLDLEEVIIDSLYDKSNSIPSFAFLNCVSLKKVTLPKDLKGISNNAFDRCLSLPKITLPKSLESIGGGAFHGCKSLTKISIGKKVKLLDNSMFQGCESLKDVSLPEGMEFIHNNAFEDCYALESISIPEGVKSIKSSAFNNCKNLKEVKLPSTLREIANSVFRNCAALESIIIPEGVEDLPASAFYLCKSLKSVTLPKTLKHIGSMTFFGCNSLDNINFPAILHTIENNAFSHTGIKEVTLFDKMMTIGTGAFSSCEELKKVDLSKCHQIKNISAQVFYGCKSLEKVILPKNLATIGDHSFAECPMLTMPKLPETVTTIYGGAFAFDTKIKRVNISKSLTSFNNSAFYECGIKDIEVSKENKFFRTDSGKELLANECFEYGEKYGPTFLYAIKDFVIPNDVQYIVKDSFDEVRDDLASLVLPKSLTTIGSMVFYKAKKLKDVNFHDTSLKEIGSFAFYDVPLNSLDLPNTIRIIDNDAFNVKVKTIMIPDYIYSIKGESFYTSNSLTSIVVGKNNPNYASLNSNIIVDKMNMSVIMSCKTSKFPEGIKSIMSLSQGKVDYDEINIPASLNDIDLSTNNYIKHFSVDKNNPYFITNSDGTALIDKRNMSLLYYQKDGIIPDGVRSLPYGLRFIKGTKKIYIPASFRLFNNSFIFDEMMEEIVVNEDNPYFDSRDNCNAIIDSKKNKLLLACNKTIIPESVTSIAAYAYQHYSLDEIFIPKHIQFINKQAFNLNKRYKSVTVDKENPYFKMSDDGHDLLYIKDSNKEAKVIATFELLSDPVKEKERTNYLRSASGYQYSAKVKEKEEERVIPQTENNCHISYGDIDDSDLPF